MPVIWLARFLPEEGRCHHSVTESKWWWVNANKSRSIQDLTINNFCKHNPDVNVAYQLEKSNLTPSQEKPARDKKSIASPIDELQLVRTCNTYTEIPVRPLRIARPFSAFWRFGCKACKNGWGLFVGSLFDREKWQKKAEFSRICLQTADYFKNVYVRILGMYIFWIAQFLKFPCLFLLVPLTNKWLALPTTTGGWLTGNEKALVQSVNWLIIGWFVLHSVAPCHLDLYSFGWCVMFVCRWRTTSLGHYWFTHWKARFVCVAWHGSQSAWQFSVRYVVSLTTTIPSLNLDCLLPTEQNACSFTVVDGLLRLKIKPSCHSVVAILSSLNCINPPCTYVHLRILVSLTEEL